MKTISEASQLISADETIDQFWITEPRKIVNKAITWLGGGKSVSIDELKAFFAKGKSIGEICDLLDLENSYGEKQGGLLLSIIRTSLEMFMAETLSNRAELSEAQENVPCDKCDNPLVFAMRDKYHEFSLDLITVLKCLKLAEKEFAIPEIPKQWWVDVYKHYRV